MIVTNRSRAYPMCARRVKRKGLLPHSRVCGIYDSRCAGRFDVLSTEYIYEQYSVNVQNHGVFHGSFLVPAKKTTCLTGGSEFGFSLDKKPPMIQ